MRYLMAIMACVLLAACTGQDKVKGDESAAIPSQPIIDTGSQAVPQQADTAETKAEVAVQQSGQEPKVSIATPSEKEQDEPDSQAPVNISSEGSEPADIPEVITPNVLEHHGNEDDCWMVVEGKVYDLTDFIAIHPGGDAILEGCGKDATALFNSKHGDNAKDKLPDYYLGVFTDMD